MIHREYLDICYQGFIFRLVLVAGNETEVLPFLASIPTETGQRYFLLYFFPREIISSKSLGSVTCTRGARCHSGECGDQGHCGTAAASHVGEEPSCAASLVLGSGSLVECMGGVSLLLRYVVFFDVHYSQQLLCFYYYNYCRFRQGIYVMKSSSW